MMHHSHPSVRGLALPAVLWTLAALMLMVGSLTYFSRVETRLSATITEQAQAEALMEAGAAYIARIMHLHPSEVGDQPPHDYHLEIDGQHIHMQLINTAGLIDINQAPPDLLNALLQTIIPDAPDTTQGILNSLRPPDTQATGSTLPPLENAHQLRTLPGMTDSIYNALRDSVAWGGGDRRVNPRLAPESVLLALAHGHSERTAAYLQARQNNPALADISMLNTAHHSTLTSQRYRLDIAVTLRGGRTLARRMWLSPTPFGDASLRVTSREELPPPALQSVNMP
ncbi:MAG: hypothetical protein AB1479_08905 [Pseudomonadota bacterium]